jgi:tRNA threonylcarbamoyladenosine biosynthesis protein TsaB
MAGDGPKLLLIETSGRIGRVGLAVGPELLAERALDAARRHARDLTPAVAELLRGRAWRPRDVAGVIVSLGPGSYTGLRVGVMAAKALAYATGCAVLGVPTFHVIANQADAVGLHLEVIADAQQEKLYVQPFVRTTPAARFAPAGELAIVPGAAWASGRRPDVAVTGPGLSMVERWLPPGTAAADRDRRDPTIGGLLEVGWDRFAAGVRDDPMRLEPIYLRPSSAEEQWDRRS